MPKIKRKTIIILIAIAVALYVVTEIAPSIINKVTPTATIEYGNITASEETTVYMLRDETVYVSSKNGEADYKVEEGKQIKKGSPILNMDIDNSVSESHVAKKYMDITERLGENVVATKGKTAKRKGVFSTMVDGLEHDFCYENFEDITQDMAKEAKDQPIDVKHKSINRKEPMFKITDNSKWYMMCFISSDKTSRFEEGKRVTVKFEDGEVRATVEKIVPDGDDWKVLLSTNRLYKNFAKMRYAKVTIITLDINGVLIPNSSITTDKENGKKVGVYVVQKTGENKFVPVRVLGNDGEVSAVTEGYYYDEQGELVETVKIYDEIIKNP